MKEKSNFNYQLKFSVKAWINPGFNAETIIRLLVKANELYV